MNMKKIFSAAFAAFLSLSSAMTVFAEMTLTGAGATFPYPIYSKWFDEYHKLHSEVKINYQSIGSGGGVKQFTAKTVDFGATDGPMNQKELFAVDGKPLHIPTVLGAVVPTYNIGSATELKFTGEVLANIFLGKIKSWDDVAIKTLNPGVQLPSTPITVVRRADGSGTTYCFTDYLSNVSPEWKQKVGTGKAVNWPVGLGGKGNEGVAGLIKQTAGSIGYVELIYAKNNAISYGSVQNKAGNFIKADVESVSAAAANVKMPADFRVSIVNAAGTDSYPISTFTWLLVYENNTGKTGQVIKNFLDWMLDEGQAMAPELGYAPLPDAVKDMVKNRIKSIS
jgi:phosphate transport system substrate-binding protein